MKRGLVHLFFSVIIPLYNKEKHIVRSIDSVLKQTYTNFELIIVDDGSTDNSVNEVMKIPDSRIKLIRQQNRGVSSARNEGIKFASHEYIGFLDADDTWKPFFLESIKNIIQMYPSAGAYGTSYEFVNINGNTTPRKKIKEIKKGDSGIVNYFKESLETPVLSASSVVIPKYVIDKIGGFPINITRGEDLDMWIRIALNFEIVIYNEICATYFLNAENRATRKERNYSQSMMQYVEEILVAEKAKGDINKYFEEYMISRIINKARYFIQNSQIEEGRVLLKRYKYTKLNKRKWLKTYLLTFKFFRSLLKALP